MKIAFWSEEDGCGTTSGMAAVASICSSIWNLKIFQMESAGLGENLYSELQETLRTATLREERSPCCLSQKAYQKPPSCTSELTTAVQQAVLQKEQLFDIIFIDCGSGRHTFSEYLLSQTDVVVVNFLQERQSLDSFFQNRHTFQHKAVYLVNQYQQDSVYNRKNLNRLYRLAEDDLGVILHNPFFRYAIERGSIDHFIRRHVRCSFLSCQFGFMQELIQTSRIILKAAGFTADWNRPSVHIT